MVERRLKKMLLELSEPALPEPSKLIAWAQMVELTGIDPSTMAELMEMEWVHPVKTGAEEYLFTAWDVYRIQKMLRLCRDLEVSFVGSSIIVDLLERIEELEKRVQELSKLV